jgi:hypothetical protein
MNSYLFIDNKLTLRWSHRADDGSNGAAARRAALPRRGGEKA